MSGDELSSNSESQEKVAAASDEDDEENSENGEEQEQEVPEYEKKRLKMIEENKRRMEAMGLHKMATSFMGSAEKVHNKKMNSDKKRGKKKKMVDEDDDEYNPNEETENGSSSQDDDEKDVNFTASGKKKVKSKSSTPMKRGPTKKKLKFDSDYVDDDESLLQAIALSLGFTDTKTGSNQRPGSNLKKNASPKTPGKNNIDKSSEDVNEDHRINEDSGKRKKKKVFTSRVQMSEDEMLVHFLQFDETDKGYITMRDIQRLATEHDFTWMEEELADMIRCFGSGEDGKVNFDDFRKIVVRCKMLKGSNDDTAG